jgi:hypothetical protein
MELKDLKDPIEIIHLIQTLCKSSNDSAFFDKEIYLKFENDIIDEDQLIQHTTWKRNELIEKNLVLLDVALIHLRIEDESKYFKLKEIILELDKKVKLIYSDVISSYPSPPPIILDSHIKELKASNKILSPIKVHFHEDSIEEIVSPEIELNTIPDRVRLLMELRIIDHLEREFPILKGNKKKLTELLMQFMNIKFGSLQPVVNAIEHDDNSTKKPKLTKKVQNVLNKYK